MKSGVIAVIGRANAGKSSLINVLVGEKISIVSPKPQTTRDRILGILNEEDYQMVFVDTPGIYRADNVLNAYMQKTVEDAMKDVDVVLFVIDVHEGIKKTDFANLERFSKGKIKPIIVLTKIDIMPEKELIMELTRLKDFDFDVVPVSARKNKNLKELKKVLLSKLPEGEKLYSEDIISDKSEKFMISEIMREKLLLKFDEEIPHGTAIIVNEFKLREDGGVYDISLDIVCEKQNHKAILIGKGGKAIKEASSFARESMEKFLGRKVFLTTYVRVKENWRDNNALIKEFGYKDGE